MADGSRPWLEAMWMSMDEQFGSVCEVNDSSRFFGLRLRRCLRLRLPPRSPPRIRAHLTNPRSRRIRGACTCPTWTSA